MCKQWKQILADYPEKEFIKGCWEFLELSGGGRAKLEAYLAGTMPQTVAYDRPGGETATTALLHRDTHTP